MLLFKLMPFNVMLSNVMLSNVMLSNVMLFKMQKPRQTARFLSIGAAGFEPTTPTTPK